MERQIADQVARLRAEGHTPKDIARRLGLRPAEVSALIRTQAAMAAGASEAVLPRVRWCWINTGWSAHLGLSGEAVAWGAADSGSGSGLVSALWAREQRYGNLSVCGCIVDVYCLGVKNAFGPKSMASDELRQLVPRYFETCHALSVEAPFELLQAVVLGAVDYARALGFEPHPDFAPIAASLGTPMGPCPITFGYDGKPYYMQGPHDAPRRILATLRRTVGDGGFNFTVGAP